MLQTGFIYCLGNLKMSKKCELTGKSPLKGHKVSHANNKAPKENFFLT